MFTVKRFKFVSRQTLFNPIEFFAVVFLFSRHAGSSSTPFFFLSLSLSLALFSFPRQPRFIVIFFPLPLLSLSLSLSLSFFIPPPARSDPIRSDPITGRKSDGETLSAGQLYPESRNFDRSVRSLRRDYAIGRIPRGNAPHPHPSPPLLPLPDVSGCILDDHYTRILPCEFRTEFRLLNNATRIAPSETRRKQTVWMYTYTYNMCVYIYIYIYIC